jgi:ABC-2 type transport system permease protein
VLLALALVSGYAMFAAMFVWAGGMQFFLLDGAEATNAFVYGGRYAATQPASVWGRPIVVVFGFFFPMAFTAFLPAMALLDLPGAAWMPSWLGWCAPVAAVWAWTLALLSWSWGVRHYQGGGG